MADRVAQLLGVLSLAAGDRFRSAVEVTVGRTGGHPAALVHLHAHPGTSVQTLARVLGVSQPAAVKIVDRLAADGLLERRPGPDHRTLALRLTETGRAAVARILSGRDRELSELLTVLQPEERERLEPLLAKLVSALAHDRPGALGVCRLCDREACCGGHAACPLQHTVR
jgi:DNA-binding MarR family transcriptional regulator